MVRRITAGLMVVSIALTVWVAFMASRQPGLDRPRSVRRAYAVTMLSVTGGIVLCLVGAGVGAMLVSREAKREYREASVRNLRSLVEGEETDEPAVSGDPRLMARAIRRSRRGFPAPNPHVGCVLVRDGEIVGEGWCAYAGAPHAEAMALAAAGDRARGADAYVTLEPCDHHGRTPPCSLALLNAGVARVFVAAADENPRAAGGAHRLRAAGIPVEIGLLADKAREVAHQFHFAVARGRPLVVAKAGCGLDGRIALPSGESQWITSPAARRAAHALRAELGAVLVGYRTVVADDPHLTARLPGAVNPPLRVVLDPRAALTGRERVFDGAAETLWIREPIPVEEALRRVGERGATGLLVEGGGRTIARFLAAGLVDRLELFMAPRVLGDGSAWCNGLDLPGLAQAPEFRWVATRRIGPDLRLTLDRSPSIVEASL